jgi:hypothetical protein
MIIERGSRTQEIIVKADCVHYEDLFPDEYLAGYKTSNEGIRSISITEAQTPEGGNRIMINNHDPDWERFVILFIQKELRVDRNGNRA